MSLITTEEAKLYLRMDSGMEDALVDSLLLSAGKLCMDVARMSAVEWNTLCDPDTETMAVRDMDLDAGETVQLRSLMKSAVFFALGYLYEHREEADHHELVMTLRNLLSSVREGVF